jgi:hypothetical protein
MVIANYNGIVISWTDEEHDRIVAIKNDPDWVPRQLESDCKPMYIGANISPALKRRATEYASERGITVSDMIRGILTVLVD